MNYVSKKILFWSLLIFTTSSICHANEKRTNIPSCKITQNFPKHSELNERSFSIRFPDGRFFVVIGHDHGDPNLKESLKSAINQTLLSNKDYLEKIHNIVLKLKPTLKHYKEELTYLKSQSDIIQFMAIEKPPDFNAHQNNIDSFYEAINREFKRRGITDSKLLNEITLLYSGPAYYQKLTKKQFTQRILYADDRAAFDQVSLMKEKFEYVQKIEQLLKRPELEKYRNEIERFRDQMYEYYWSRGVGFNYEVFNKLENTIIPEKLNSFPPELRETLNILVRDEFAIAKVMVTREKTMVNTLLSAYQSGVFTVGLQHLKNLSLELESECQTYLKRMTDNYKAPTPYTDTLGTQ